jgi:hypothetical protein
VGECAEEKQTALDETSLGTDTTIADHLWAAPAGTQPEVHLDPTGSLEFHPTPCVARDVHCVNDWTTQIYWVWPEYASLEMGSRGDCGAHPDWTPGYTVRSLNDLEKPLRIGEVLGGQVEAALRKNFESEHQDAGACPDRAVFEPDSWYIERKHGAWKTTGWSTTHRLCGFGIDYAIDADISRIAGRQDDRSVWSALETTWPQRTDAHVSPGGRWTLVATETELMIFDRRSLRSPVVRMPKSRDEHLVMVEWATGRNVAAWNAEVVRLLSTKEPAPRVIRRER